MSKNLITAVLLPAFCLFFADGVRSKLFGDDELQKVEETHTEKADFPSGGLLRLKNSTGELTIEGWDRPDVEITTIKSRKDEYPPEEREKASRDLNEVQISVAPQGQELVITTTWTDPRLWGTLSHVNVSYLIKAPRNARLAIEHKSGEVYVDNVDSDIEASLNAGDLILHLPQEVAYNIDAKSVYGRVQSVFPGRERRRPWLYGHYWAAQKIPPARNLHLRARFGDIVILKIEKPTPPEPLTR